MLLVLLCQLSRACSTALDTGSVGRVLVLELVRESVVVHTLLNHPHFVADKDGGKGFFDDGPKNGHRGTDNGKVDFEAGEDDEAGGPPGVVDVRIGGTLGFYDAVQASDCGSDNAATD